MVLSLTLKEIVNILITLNDYYSISSNYLINCKKSNKQIRDKEPFYNGFLSEIEKREEVVKRLNLLESREREVLLLYYTFGKEMNYIANHFNLSIRQCYRIKKQALYNLLNIDDK